MFISQCGLQSFQEAVYFGVPILGIPFFGDQKYNAKKIVTEELGVQLSLQDLTKETLSAAINAVLNDPRYVQVTFIDLYCIKQTITMPS